MREFFLKMWIAVAGFFTYWYLKLRVYKTWSNIYRWLYERKYKSVVIPTFPSLHEIAKLLDGKKWRADGFFQLFDVISTPERAYMVLSGKEPQPKLALDCDEFMIFAVHAIRSSIMHDDDFIKNEPRLIDAMCLTVTWVELTSGKASGHNVALLILSGGNLNTPLYTYMDYGMPFLAPKATIEEVVEYVRNRYAKGPTSPLAFCISELDLTPTKVVRG